MDLCSLIKMLNQHSVLHHFISKEIFTDVQLLMPVACGAPSFRWGRNYWRKKKRKRFQGHSVSNTDQLQNMLLSIYVELVFLHLATSSHKVIGNCKENVTLKCDGIKKGSFNSITWTKQPSWRIIRRSLGQKWHYDFNRTADLTDENSLLLPDLTPEDSGTYECLIGANPGGQNSMSKVFLEVPVCATEPPAPEPPDLPITKTVGCFLAICLLKLLLPVIVAQVFHGLQREVKSENPLPLN